MLAEMIFASQDPKSRQHMESLVSLEGSINAAGNAEKGPHLFLHLAAVGGPAVKLILEERAARAAAIGSAAATAEATRAAEAIGTVDDTIIITYCTAT